MELRSLAGDASHIISLREDIAAPGGSFLKRFPARLLVEALPQQDQYESHPVAHRALALARLLSALQRGGR